MTYVFRRLGLFEFEYTQDLESKGSVGGRFSLILNAQSIATEAEAVSKAGHFSAKNVRAVEAERAVFTGKNATNSNALCY